MTTARNKPAPKPVKAWAMMSLDGTRPHVHLQIHGKEVLACWSLYRSRKEALCASGGVAVKEYHVAPVSTHAVVDKANVRDALSYADLCGTEVRALIRGTIMELGLLPLDKPTTTRIPLKPAKKRSRP